MNPAILICSGPSRRAPCPVDGASDLYEITSDGRVWSVRSEIYLSPRVHKGYQYVTLNLRGKKFTVTVHRLVALAFLENPNRLPFVNHRDLNKVNNDVSNLEWCTPHQNIWHYELTRTNRNWVGRVDGLTANEADRIEALYKTGLIGVSRLARAFGVSKSTVWRIVNGEGHAVV